MIPNFKTYIKESVWGDIRKRGNGTEVKQEDDINNMDMSEFCNYLYLNYWPTEWNDGEVIDQFSSLTHNNIWRIQIPIEAYKQNGTTKKLTPPITMEFNKSTGKLESILLSSHLLKNYPELKNIYKIEFDEFKVAHIVPQKGKLTNKVCVDVIDGVLNIVNKPLFYKKTHKYLYKL